MKPFKSFSFCLLLAMGAAACLMETGEEPGAVEAESTAQIESSLERADCAEAEVGVSALRPIGSYCHSPCVCVLGSDCIANVCTAIPVFSPPPPTPPCARSCQCPYPKSCVFSGGSYGVCESPTEPCISDCDCGVTATCSNGQCQVAFGPYPQCRCDKHCPNGKQCVNGGCQ